MSSMKNSTGRRRFGRRMCRLDAMAHVGGRPATPCIVRNISETGALLEFSEPFNPSYKFRIVIELLNIDTFCEIRHQGDYGIGVRFLAERERTHPSRTQTSTDTLLSEEGYNSEFAAALRAQDKSRTSGLDLRKKFFKSEEDNADASVLTAKKPSGFDRLFART